MNLDELQTVRDRERQTDKLQQLRASFYADAGEFIQQLHTERERAAEHADDPFDAPAVSQLTDEIQTAEQTVEAIYEKRVGKLVKAASFAAADLPAEVDGMTAEEEELFDTLVDDIKQNREHVLSVLAGDDDKDTAQPPTDDAAPAAQPPTQAREHPDAASGAGGRGDGADGGASGRPTPPTADLDEAPPDAAAASEPTDAVGGDSTDFTAAAMGSDDTKDADRQVRNDGGRRARGDEQAETGTAGTGQATSAAHANSGQAEGADEELETPHVERETVRITADVGTFVGTDDREYDLGENDIVQLPAANVGPLLERDAAEQLDF